MRAGSFLPAPPAAYGRAIGGGGYATSIVVYVSSTADIFINGVGHMPWLPLVLAGLSILGILVGIWLRVRAFLLLGTAFLLVSLLTIIWMPPSTCTGKPGSGGRWAS